MTYNVVMRINLWATLIFLCSNLSMILVKPEQDVVTKDREFYFQARCAAKCYRIFTLKPLKDEYFPSTVIDDQSFDPNSQMVTTCLVEQEKCSQSCFEACANAEHPICQTDNVGCKLGRGFYLENVHSHQGNCPARSVSNFFIKSHRFARLSHKLSCESDNDCANPMEKCCKLERENSCIESENDSIKVPGKPSAPSLRLNEQGSVDIIYKKDFSHLINNEGPIVLVLQIQTCSCWQWNETIAQDWTSFHLMLYESDLTLNSDMIIPGHLYRVRIAAVNAYGSRGFGEPSDVYPLVPKKPRPPKPPTNVREQNLKYNSDHKYVELTLAWDKPEMSDLPVHFINISWVQDLGFIQSDGRPLESLIIYSKIIPATEQVYTIENLLSGASYKIELVSVSIWHNFGPLKSKPFTKYAKLQTIYPSVSYTTKQKPDFPEKPSRFLNKACDCGMKEKHSFSHLISIDPPEFYRDDLTAVVRILPSFSPSATEFLVEWTPRVCIQTNDNSYANFYESINTKMNSRVFRLTKLKYHCRYSVNVTALKTPEAQGESVTTCFCTRSCYQTKVDVNTGYNKCQNTAKVTPQEPTDMRILSLAPGKYKLSWQHIDLGLPDDVILRFRVVYGPREQEPIDVKMYNDGAGFSPIMNKELSQARVLPGHDREMILSDLQPDSLYIVKLQALYLDSNEANQGIESAEISQYFMTDISHTRRYQDSDFKIDNGSNLPLYNPPLLLSLLSIWSALFMIKI